LRSGAMDEIERIADQLQRAYDGDPWYGSSLRSLLDEIDETRARQRAVAGVHTIAEIVRHIASWHREVARRLRDGIAREPAAGDWPAVGGWEDALRELADSHRELLVAIRGFPAERLLEIVGDERDRPLGSGVSFYVMLHGIVQHTIAHTAQISLLIRASS
jgi:uncharacterized damage-inducible protein DinB